MAKKHTVGMKKKTINNEELKLKVMQDFEEMKGRQTSSMSAAVTLEG